MSKKQVTFADIAAYTHFSKTTISRYFNHPDSLTLENQEKISQALDILGYKKNKLAKVLANGKRRHTPAGAPASFRGAYRSPRHSTGNGDAECHV